MARWIYLYPGSDGEHYHLLTDLDFWDAKRILKDLAVVKRNFGAAPPGDEFPTKVELKEPTKAKKARIERRLQRAVASPPRHVIVREMLAQGVFAFDPSHYYPRRWSRERMLHFTMHRLPLHQPALCSPYHTVRIGWREGRIRVERVPRPRKYDPVIADKRASSRRLRAPSCF